MTRRNTAGHCCPAVCWPRAFPGLALRHTDRLPIPGGGGHPQSLHSSLQPSPSLAGDAALPTSTCNKAPLAPHRAKDKGSCHRGAAPVACAAPSFRADTKGLQQLGITGPFPPDGGWVCLWDASLS